MEKLKEQIPGSFFDFKPITKKPEDFEPNILKACMLSKISSVQWLIEKEKIDVNIGNDEDDVADGNVGGPLLVACMFNQLQIAMYIINKGANIHVKDDDNNTPLHWAAENGHINIVKFLILKGANKNAKNKKGKREYDLTQLDCIRKLLK